MAKGRGGRRLTLEGDKQKHRVRVHNTFRFRPSVGPPLPALEVINPAEPRLRVFNFRATFLFMCTTYRNRFCRLKLLKSVEINENPDRSIVTRVQATTPRHPRPFSPFFGDLVFVTECLHAVGETAKDARSRDWCTEEKIRCIFQIQIYFHDDFERGR